MKKISILLICLLASFAPCSFAHCLFATTEQTAATVSSDDDEKTLPLLIKENDPGNNGKPEPRTLIPEVTMQENNLRFITPCNGCVFRLAQNETICYSTEIIGNTLTIPNTFTGTYELQIVSGDIIFYTEVEL